jgi:protein SCO1/2
VILSRRAWLSAAAGAALGVVSGAAKAHNDVGRVDPPRPAPASRLVLDDGTKTTFDKLLRGRVSAVQVMFTRCTATCPIQGALFAGAIRDLGAQAPDAQCLSLTLDPEFDGPGALRGWRERFSKSSRWRAARPDPRDLDPLLNFLRARTSGADRHTAQVYFFDRRGAIVLRTVDFPQSSEIARMLVDLAGRP